MQTSKLSSLGFLRIVVPAVLLATVTSSRAAPTFWTGPTNTFSHAAFSSTVDKLTTNHVAADAVNNVWLTRGPNLPLFNSAAESSWSSTSPLKTTWALASGPLTSAASLTYGTFANVVGAPHTGNGPGVSVGRTFYVHIVPDDIYLVLKLTAWGHSDGGSFSYQRSSSAVTLPTPTISITNPVSGAVFAAPANLKFGANAAVSGGTVTNVHFFANGISQGTVGVTPFTLTSSALAAGSYALTAVATAAGISATSAVVNVSVVNPVVVNLSSATANNGKFSFSYAADAGLAYVVQSSTNLVDWVSLVTNVAPGSPVPFTNGANAAAASFYRVGRLPNP